MNKYLLVGMMLSLLFVTACKGDDPQPDSYEYISTCFNGQFDEPECQIDCGGFCDPCPVSCSDCIQNQDETNVDCGGPNCDPCPPGCEDGIQNQDEIGVDCGGTSCPPCPTCVDGIQNQDETGVDCGGTSCPPCPTCVDGIQNQGEQGIDCGGPCPAC